MLEPQDVRDLLERGKPLLVGVREPAEFAVERIHGALLYPLSTFDASTSPLVWARRGVRYCGSGKRSLPAAEQHLAAGNDKAARMGGGVTAWKRAGLPVISINPATGGTVDRR
jgi:rhodanese-related sulfurtransferase